MAAEEEARHEVEREWRGGRCDDCGEAAFVGMLFDGNGWPLSALCEDCLVAPDQAACQRAAEGAP